MPSNVKIFLALSYLSVALGIVHSIFDFPILAATAAPLGGAKYVIIVQTLTFAILLTIFSLVGFGRQNWARWLLLGMFILGTPFYVLSYFYGTKGTQHSPLYDATQFALQLTALYFIFTGNARQWFKRTRDVG